MQYRPFQFVPENPYGRDFIVGDIHGMFSTVDKLLAKIEFDPETDRLFSVGDMIDRGPASWRVIEFLNKPWFHAVMGNHERMLLDSENSERSKAHWVSYNGGAWWERIPEHLRSPIYKRLAALPVALEIRTAMGRVGVVHADVPVDMGWRTFINRLQNSQEVRDFAVWSRTRYKQAELRNQTPPISGLDLLVVGHTPVREAHQIANIYFIDTGAYYGSANNVRFGKLTLLEVHPALKIHQISTRVSLKKRWLKKSGLTRNPPQPFD